MAHGSKKWIRTWRGRLKRSRNRTQDDWLGELKNDEKRRPKHCPQCKYLNKARPIQHYYRREVTRWMESTIRHTVEHTGYSPSGVALYRLIPRLVKYPMSNWTVHTISVAEYHRLSGAERRRWSPSYEFSDYRECEPCKRKDRAMDLHYTGVERRRWYKGGVPAEFRRDLEKKRRAKVRAQFQRAKHQPDLYDEISTKPDRKDAAWLYW